ncbi:MAG: hypothetical protein INR73_09805 [Williamsia sp.]|nr:hypothetical protein [Williamsia sp.]
MNDHQLLELIDNYMAGKASGEEIRQLQAWLDALNDRPSPLSSLSHQELETMAGKMFSVINSTLDAQPNGEDALV